MRSLSPLLFPPHPPPARLAPRVRRIVRFSSFVSTKSKGEKRENRVSKALSSSLPPNPVSTAATNRRSYLLALRRFSRMMLGKSLPACLSASSRIEAGGGGWRVVSVRFTGGEGGREAKRAVPGYLTCNFASARATSAAFSCGCQLSAPAIRPCTSDFLGLVHAGSSTADDL